MSQRLEDIIRARLLVAGLGERAPSPWWRSQATSEVSGRWLERLFPRTAPRAALEMASRAAQAAHDARLGGTGVYHLFRLPGALEADIHDLLARGKPELVPLLKSVTGEEAMRLLLDLAGSEPLQAAAGPVNCGSVSALQRGRGLQRLCAVYAAAFRSDVPSFPYLEPEQR